MAEKDLTSKEVNDLFDYLSKLDKLERQEPPRVKDILTPEEFQAVQEYIVHGGAAPECIDKVKIVEVTDDNGETRKAIDDTAWEKWHNEVMDLVNNYSGIIGKTLLASYSDWQGDYYNVTDILKYYLSVQRPDLQMFAEDPEAISAGALAVRDAGKKLMDQSYVLLLNSNIFNTLFSLSLSQFKQDPRAHVATYRNNGVEIKAHNYEDIKNITSSQLKLWDAAMMYLTFINYKQAQDPRTTVEIPLKEYAEIRGRDITASDPDDPKEKEKARKRKTKFKNDLEKDLDVLQRIKYSFTITSGPAAGNYKDLPLILNNPEISGAPGHEVIKISFDKSMAKMLLGNNQYMRYAIKLQGLNSSNPNNVPVGRYMNLHASMYGNQKRGNDLTLTVKSLLSAAPYIDTKEKLDAQGQGRNWRKKIKEPLETVLDNLVKGDILKQWQYRHAKTGNTLTPEEIVKIKMSWNEYENLDVDYSLAEPLPARNEIERSVLGLLEGAST